MTLPPMDSAAREALIRRQVRHRINALRVKAAVQGKPSPWGSSKMRSTFEELFVARSFDFPPEDSKTPS